MALEDIGLLSQDTDPGSTTLVDALNCFNDMSRLEMHWTVRHRWPAGVRFAFNCYRHWAQLLFCQPGYELVIILV